MEKEGENDFLSHTGQCSSDTMVLWREKFDVWDTAVARGSRLGQLTIAVAQRRLALQFS